MLLRGLVPAQSLDLPARPGLAARNAPAKEAEKRDGKHVGGDEIRITHGPPERLAGRSPFEPH